METLIGTEGVRAAAVVSAEKKKQKKLVPLLKKLGSAAVVSVGALRFGFPSTSPLNSSPRLLGLKDRLLAGPAPVPVGSRADLSSASDPEWVVTEAISEGGVSESVFSLLRYPLFFPCFLFFFTGSSSSFSPFLFFPSLWPVAGQGRSHQLR